MLSPFIYVDVVLVDVALVSGWGHVMCVVMGNKTEHEQHHSDENKYPFH